MRLEQLMTTDVITVGPDSSLKEAARRMVEAGISGLPVTDDSARVIGIITEADFVSGEADRRTERRAGLLRFLGKEAEIPDHERLVRDVMTTGVITITPDADHAEAARVMERHGIKRIPVVDEDGRLVGVVSRADILRAFVRADAEIVDEIESRVVRDILWIDPRRVTVTCMEGNVTLEGRVETRSAVQLMGELTRRLDGVASVDNRLTYEVDNLKLEMVGVPPGMRPRRNW